MSQNPYAQFGQTSGPSPYGPEFAVPPAGRTSILAIISLVLSVIGCVACIVPGTGGLAVLLGSLSILLIAFSNGRTRGVGIAATAICLGAFQTLVWFLAFFAVYQPVMGGWRSAVVGPVGQIMTDIDKGDLAAARAQLTPRAQGVITEDMLADFGKRYRAANGEFQNFPSEPLEIWQTYQRIAPSFRALDDGSGQPNNQNLIPLPGKFAKREALVILQLDEKGFAANKKSSRSSGKPFQMPVLNLGVATTDGKIVWLVDPDTARAAGRKPKSTGDSKHKDPENPESKDSDAPDAPDAPAAPHPPNPPGAP